MYIDTKGKCYPNRNDIFILSKRDYPNINGVSILMVQMCVYKLNQTGIENIAIQHV